MASKNEGSDSFPVGETPQEIGGFEHVPKCYIVEDYNRSTSEMKMPDDCEIPVIDMAGMSNGSRRAAIIEEVSRVCKAGGFFQIVNHGIPESVLDRALSTATDFFNLPTGEKMKLMSAAVDTPIRYCTSIKDGIDRNQLWRVFLKHYANPLDKYVLLWPENPPEYREKMGEYAKASLEISLLLTEAITEGLGLGPDYITKKIKKGIQAVVVNCYPPCPQPDLSLGLPPHSDYSFITVVLQSSAGLQIQDPGDLKWRDVPHIKGALQVNVGDCLEVLSNGLCKSVVHRVKVNSDCTRISVASLHSVELEEKMVTAPELVSEQRPMGYKDSSFKEFLDYISKNDLSEGKNYMDTLRL